MAVDSMWIAIASVLALFEIKKAVDEDGREITPDGEYIRGFLWYVALYMYLAMGPDQRLFLGHFSHPKPFPCVIKPRSKEHEQLLNVLANQDA